MDNGIVLAVCQELVKTGLATLRFNFRGVGESGGKYGEGLTEQEDVKAAVSLLSARAGIDAGRIGLAGYAFGGSVCAAAALDDSRVQAVALISTNLTETVWKRLRAYPNPRMFIAGSDDRGISQKMFLDQTERMSDPVQSDVVHGADQRWWGLENDLSKRVAAFVTRYLCKAPQTLP